MLYTVWSRGEPIGTTELGFRGVGFERARSGHFHPNARGEELMEELASDSHCMRAYMHRNYRDAEGNDLIDPEYVGCDWFADVAEHLHQTAHFDLELRDENNVHLSVAEVGIQDKHPDWPVPLTPEQLAAYRVTEQAENERRKEREALVSVNAAGSHPISEADQKMLDEMLADDEEHMEGCEYFDTPCDITTPVGWGYEETQGDNELGSGWNTTLRDLPDFPRYQVHVILGAGAD
ncbi:MAG: hypothetical protein ABJB74_10090 [Gemmatimonas sp.]